jgi:hypothetical protein
MLSKAETDLLCQVGPGTPMGDVFRRFWIPVLLAEELPEPDSDPVAIRVLGEDLVAFRATSGKVGLTSAYCAHRHAHLYWGRNEQEGIRCTYHGYWRVRPFLVPSSIIIPGGDQPGRNLSGHVWVPVDDNNVWVYTMTWNVQRPLAQDEIDAMLSGRGIHCPVDKEVGRWDLKISRGYKPVRNIDNEYMINRSVQRERSFTGINGTSEQDCSIQESMGRISPRWEEHLGTADRGIIEFRRILLQLARDMQAGRGPEHASRAEAYRVRSTAFVVEPDTDWENSAAEHMKALV